MELFEKIKMIRQSKGVTQTHVANSSGMTVSNYNMKENGKRTITTDDLESIARALEVPVGIFFDENIHVKLNSNSTDKEVI